VVVPQRAIKRLVIDTDFIAFESQTFLLHSALSFDASTLELWGGLLNGGTCVMFPQEQVLSPASLRPVIREQGVTTLWLTASVFNWLTEEDCSVLAPLQQVLTGGEALSVKHVCEAVRQLPNTRIFNGYGPTENTTFSTVYPIPEDITVNWESVPIGWPIPGTDCAVVNADKELLSGECEGQLVVTGSGLAMGYLNQPDLSEKVFIHINASDGKSEQGYLTGDLVRRDAQGCFHYLGRIDKQVKIDGRRIEPGEIESVLKKLKGVKDARVVALATPQGSMRLVAYWTGEHEVAASLREHLLHVLPRYCVPHFFIQVERFPVTQNGKLDVQALPCPFDEQSANAQQDDIDGLVEACWRAVLGRAVEHNINFLDAGGTSLEALKLAQRLAGSVGRELPATFVFEFPTIQAQARHLNSATGSHQLDSAREPEADVAELAVVGMACRLPGANNVQEFWQNLTEGRESIRFFSPEELSPEVPFEEYQSPHYVPAKGVIEGADCFDAAFFGISPAEARLMDPQHRLMLQLAWHALEDAGYAPAEEGLDAGIYVGANWGRYYQQYVLPNKAATDRFGAFNTALLNEPDFLSTRLSYKLNLRGPSVNVYTACSTGLVAVAEACAAIVRGDCKMALAGGVSVSMPLFAGYRYQEGGMLSADGHCRPFDAQASGTTFNDGAGFVVLKRLDQALRDGDNIYACVKGYAVNNDGSGKASYTAPSVSGQVAVYREALKRSGVNADTIGFIETHGTATPLGDPIEVAALKQVYQRDADADSPCALGSVKSNIGHVIHAAGIASFIKTCLSVKHGIVPATLHFSQANPKLELDSSRFFVNAEYCPWPQSGLRRAAVSSLGVGGTNAHVIIEQFEQNAALQAEKPEAPVLYLSAKSEVALKKRMADWVTLLQQPDADALFRHQCYAMARQPAFDYRCATTASSAASLADKLNKNIDRTSKALSNTPKKTGLLFTGQGAQRPGMGSWFYQHDPEYRERLDHAASILHRDHQLDLLQALNDATNPERLNQTALTQPALFILEWALAKHMLERGAHVDFLIGHSIGEYAAAVIAGIMEFDDALRLVIARGTLMQSMPRGAMLAVKAEPDEVAPLLTEGLVIAAVNGPKLVVLAGPCEKIDAAETQAARSGLSVTRLKTSHAFHSPMMDDMLQDFAKVAAKVRFSEPGIAIYSTLTGNRVEREMCNADYWVQQVRQPVQFSAALCSASDTYSDQELALIEVGPGNTLTSLALMHSLQNLRCSVAAAPDACRSQQAEEDINSVLARLWQHGFKVNRSALFKTKLQHVPIPLYPFDTQRYWLEQGGSIQATEAATVSTTQAITNLQVSTMSASDHREQVSQKLLAVIEDITGYELGDLDPETHFNEAGLDSLLLTQVAIALDQQFGGNITFRDLVEQYNTLEALCDFYVDVIPAETPVSNTAPVN
ncbi:MAG: beta-ketoacyl synthase N-terminal-like domain-containing protein, partial [Oleiphilaceae bacterium]|nr:beta-ketoacyl synthase N-terminal-like domain-containing protein [Oleiphilaceae bacterium]